jgi:hypothetical protein
VVGAFGGEFLSQEDQATITRLLVRRVASNEGIVTLLVSDGCSGTVTGKHLGFVGERVQFPLDICNQSLMVAAGQVGAADASGEKNVATKEDLLFRQEEAEAARTVARN